MNSILALNSIVLCLLISTATSYSFTTIIQNLARGSALRCICDLCGGLPFEIWKSTVVLENIKHKKQSDYAVLQSIYGKHGLPGFWRGTSPRMIEGFFSGAVLYATKEAISASLTHSPTLHDYISPAVIDFMAGAGGGAAQAIVMTPCSLLVTAASINTTSTAFQIGRDVLRRKGIPGIYRGFTAVAFRQATNWASRQGFTAVVRPYIGITGAAGAVLAGCIGGALSCWNTPFEVTRIYSQTEGLEYSLDENGKKRNLFETMQAIQRDHGISRLFVGLGPRCAQAAYQTVFMVCVPKILSL